MRALLVLVALAGCHPKAELTAPPPPLRPEPEPGGDVKAAPKDCEPVDPAHELKALTFEQRSIPESVRLTEQARTKLKTGEGAEVDRATKEQMLTDAVNDFLTALAADPYNVNATYGLAGAYAVIGRTQCSLNLLARLLQMRPHASKHTEVEAAIDRLLGRRQALDPDFAAMRRDERFRTLIGKMCEGTNDPSCVYGGQKR